MKSVCPHCKQEFPEMPDEYLGVSVECSVCHNVFICEESKICARCGAVSPVKALKCAQCGNFFIRKNQSVETSAVRAASAPSTVIASRSAADTSSGGSFSFFSWKTIVLVLLLVGGYYFIVKPWHEKQSQDTQNESIKKDIYKLFSSNGFIYSGGQVTDVQFQKDSSLYMVTFHYNGKLYRRPFRYRQSTPNNDQYYFIEAAFKYSEKPEYLVEDAEIFWKKYKEGDPELASYNLIEVKPLSPGVVRCTYSNGEETEKADLRVTETYVGGTPHLQYQFMPVLDFHL